jgi:hypothetical protein
MDSIIRGQYQPLEKLGSGGMGDVIKAKDLKLNRMVALKFLRADHSGDPTRRQRFMHEAQAASALNHPNIITIHDVITEDDADIMVMEMVAGKTLDAIIPRGGLRVSQIINYSAQVADALAAAHGAGIIHRDLKPGNIMVTERDLVKLLDFGLAKLAPGTFTGDPEATSLTPLTVRGTIVGTLSYMSPEQAQGKASDGRADIFSFGAVLYEMATGNRAFTGENGISTLTSVLRDEPRRVLEITPEVPEVLSDVIHKCLQKDPDERFQTMAEVRDALMRLRQLSSSGSLYAQSPLASGIMSQPVLPTSVGVPAAAIQAAKSSVAKAKPAAVAAKKPAVAAKKPTAVAKTEAGAAAGSNRTAMMAGAAVVVVALAAGGWWFSTRPGTPVPPQPDPLATTPAPVPTSEPVAATPDPAVPPPVTAVTPVTDAAKVVPDTAKPAAPRPAAPAGTRGRGPATAAAAPVAAPVAETVVLLVPVPDALPVALELQTEIPLEATAGMVLKFTVTRAVTVGGETVIANGATATGVVVSHDKKKATIQLHTVDALDGTKLNIRATAGQMADSMRTIETPGQKSKTVVVSPGAATIGYLLGQQAVRLRK